MRGDVVVFGLLGFGVTFGTLCVIGCINRKG